jgi:AraC-like DNA-binding protein/quercetin dioxygenase-like cupin family protein
MLKAALLETKRSPRFSPVAAGDFVRTPESFDDPGDVPDVLPADLDRLLHAITVDAVSALEWRWKTGWKIGPRTIHDSMWFYIAEGHGRGWTGTSDNRFQYRPGSLILLAPDTPHFIEPAGNSRSHVFAVHFHARVFGAVSLLNLLGVPPICNSGEEDSFASASARLAAEFALKKSGWRPVMEAETRSVLFQVLRRCARGLKANIHLSALSDMPRLLPVFQYIESDLHKPDLWVGDMAKRAYLSEVQFRKIFRRITGDSPLRFVQRKRIERACNMLHTSTDAIGTIAEACGFSDAPFFHRVFKAWTGTTPRDYRNGLMSIKETHKDA